MKVSFPVCGFPIQMTDTCWQQRILARADVIVTANLRDFPEEIVGAFGIEAQHPDEFILNLLDLAPGIVAAAAEEHRQSLKNPGKTLPEYLATLEIQV